jgi:hypothetical protein
MTPLRRRVVVAIVGLLLAGVSTAAAQSLADLARRAEADRKARPDTARRYEITAEPDVLLTPLTRDVVSLHARLRMDMARMWTRDRGLFQRLHAGGSNARSFEESCRVLEHEPEIIALLTRYESSPYSFFSVMVSIRQAEGLADGIDGYHELTPVQLANRDFAGRNGAWLSAIRGQILRAEAGWSLFE